jgi:2-polyprenyl-3-methyl-5-hydroxy-6-metoxy-1,4-benzoquinol methylase
MAHVHEYVGSELDLFAQARNWKRYVRRQLAAFIRGDVLEVGAGIGGTTQCLYSGEQRSWTCLEPDTTLAERIRPALRDQMADGDALEIVVGTVEDLPDRPNYDALLYIDVLEHIEQDGDELRRAARLLRPGGRLIVLSPAHGWLYSPFDEAIGHHRRYTRSTLRAVQPPGVTLRRCRYLDSVGLLASLGNRLMLKSPQPTLRQIAFWDRLLVPASRLLDPLLGYRFGKTVYAVWQRVPPIPADEGRENR